MRSSIAALLLTLLLGPAVFAADAGDSFFEPDSLYRHVAVLAHDSLEGRKVGEDGEMKAARYIWEFFTTIGLQPLGTDDEISPYLQPFEFVKAIEYGDNNWISVNQTKLKLGEDYSPMKQSASGEFVIEEVVSVGFGIKMDTADGNYNDYEGLDVTGKAVIIKRYSPSEEDYPNLPFERYSSLTQKISTAMEHDASAVIFITPPEHDDTLPNFSVARVQPKEIPILHVRRKALEELGLDLNDPLINSVEGSVEIVKVRDHGYNVVGLLPGNTDTTIIVGAHYDHLGYGGEGSRYLGPEKLIHNGADDNASGTAVMMELARWAIANKEEIHHSMLFIGFSGEESGILGSSHYARNMTIDSSDAKLMINMDMIGRLKDQDGLAVLGVGSSPELKTYFDSLPKPDFEIKINESGIGPSDHTAFYNRKIPVLFFFTGAHADYHKPEDDIELLDFPGLAAISELVAGAMTHFDDHRGPLTFQKTKSDDEGRTRRQFSVTLGIMPDFISEVKGLRVDGVSPDRPGEKAGLLEGDIIIKMGSVEIGDIYDYMNALGKYRKGDSTIVLVKRGDKEEELSVVFQ